MWISRSLSLLFRRCAIGRFKRIGDHRCQTFLRPAARRHVFRLQIGSDPLRRSLQDTEYMLTDYLFHVFFAMLSTL